MLNAVFCYLYNNLTPLIVPRDVGRVLNNCKPTSLIEGYPALDSDEVNSVTTRHPGQQLLDNLTAYTPTPADRWWT